MYITRTRLYLRTLSAIVCGITLDEVFRVYHPMSGSVPFPVLIAMMIGTAWSLYDARKTSSNVR